jgi:hypothetical protein
MATLSAAEQIASTTPVPFTSVTVAPGKLDFYFYNSPENVAAFADRYGLPVALNEHHGGTDRPYLEGRGDVEGISVHAWALGLDGEMDRYRACVPAAGLPAEWSARGAA